MKHPYRWSRLAVTGLVIVLGFGVQARADTITLDVTADFDGRDDLIIAGNTLQWEHFDFTPVGLHNSAYPSTIVTTTLNVVTELSNYAWTASWPNGTNAGAYSSLFSGLNPAIPAAGVSVTLNVEQARESITLVQLPTAGNGDTTIVEFDDDEQAGDALYEAKLTFTTSAVPEPATLLMGFLGLSLVGGYVAIKKRRSSLRW
jgi:hypothetical protein